MTKYYINLTAGLEAIDSIPFELNIRKQLNFVRLQSTYMEKKLFNKFILSIDDDLLFHLSIGVPCIVYDFSSRNNESRACWQGLGFLKYCLTRIWKDEKPEKWFIKSGINCADYFEIQYRKLDRQAKNKLKYYSKYFATANRTKSIHLSWICKHTNNDSNEMFYSTVTQKYADWCNIHQNPS